MRGRLYYTAKAKKTGKVMVKVHPCSRLCFCKCWTCFKEVPGPASGDGSGKAGALGLQALSRPLGSVPCPHPMAPGPFRAAQMLWLLALSFLSTVSCLPVENVVELKPSLGLPAEQSREACSCPLLVLDGRTRKGTVGCCGRLASLVKS